MTTAEPRWQRDLEHYLSYLRFERGYASRTLQTYRQQLCLLAGSVAANAADFSWQQQTESSLQTYLASGRRRGLSARSLALTVAALRGLYRYLQQQQQVSDNPAQYLTVPKPKAKLPKNLDIDTLQHLLSFDSSSDVLACRDKAMLELFYSSGLRLAELVGANINDIDWREQLIRVRGKGSKERQIPIGSVALAALQQWRSQRPLLLGNATPEADQNALFLSKQQQRISARQVRQRVNHWAKVQGLGQQLHPHMLRHSFASHVLQSSGDLRAVQDLLGHANLSTTQVYTHLDFQHLAAVYDNAHPRARKKP
ncbi:site-specific tyrosine recombinase XerC [Arsukibacterium ikkense]|uniref:Tyrosine recombinase XerC n=1 Tax=Arsukibacterium ikkense TaxID=336831 RepID=A0A0M2UZV6_9GAMM|nr:tyrosine recombinase XerC [Arsukibacterium ikkense]KKO43891.1 site-specific tyrosine recombinase XerC [Arsukibacterium ikkense]